MRVAALDASPAIEPQSILELQILVRNAAMNGTHLRVVGSAHSQLLVQAHPHDVLFAPAETVRFVRLSAPVFNYYEVLPEAPPAGTAALVRVGAGMQVGQDVVRRVPASWSDTLVSRLWDDGFALPNLPGVIVQTVGGLVASGSDGGSFRHSLPNALQSIRFVNGRGEMREVWVNDTARGVALFGGHSHWPWVLAVCL